MSGHIPLSIFLLPGAPRQSVLHSGHRHVKGPGTPSHVGNHALMPEGSTATYPATKLMDRSNGVDSGQVHPAWFEVWVGSCGCQVRSRRWHRWGFGDCGYWLGEKRGLSWIVEAILSFVETQHGLVVPLLLTHLLGRFIAFVSWSAAGGAC